MKFTRLLAVIAVVVLVFCLFGCNGGKDPSDTGAPEVTTSPNASTPPATQLTEDAAFDGYIVTVVDEGGNPIAGAFVQLCLDSCYPAVTDASGIAKFDLEEAEYKVSFVSLPAGYAYASDVQEFYFASGSKELTITLKAVA